MAPSVYANLVLGAPSKNVGRRACLGYGYNFASNRQTVIFDIAGSTFA